MAGSKVALFLPDLRGGGAERVAVNLANAFVDRGIDVEMVVMRLQGELLAQLDQQVRVIDLGTPRQRHVLLPLIRYLRRSRPKAVLANMWPLTILAALARLLSRVRTRVVAVEHTTWSASCLAQRRKTRLSIKTTMHALLPRTDAIVAVSKGAAADLERFAGLRPGSARVIYNPVAGARQATSTSLHGALAAWAHGPHKRVLAVGTLKAVKDFPLLLQAFARLCKTENARLLILGEGEERQRLEALVKELGLEQAVSLPGFVADTAAAYAHADLFVLSSTNEGLPTVIIEALEHGVPVVSTDCPSGPREILAGGQYGTLVPVADTEALASAMRQALAGQHDPEALKRRAQDFSVDKAADAYLDLLLPGWRSRGSV